MRVIMLAAGMAAAFSSMAVAQAPQAISISFTPPAQPLKLKAEQTRSILANGTTEMALAVETTDELKFERNADGWLLRWSSSSIKVNGQGAAATDSVGQEWTDVPIEYQLSTTGQPVRVLNFAQYRAQAEANWTKVTAKAQDDVAALPPEKQEAARRYSLGLIAALRAMTEAKTERDLLVQPAMLFGFGGRTVTPGAPNMFETQVAGPGGTPVKLTGQARVQANSDGAASIDVITSNLMAGATQAAGGTAAAAPANGMFTQEATLRVHPKDGMPVEASSRKTMMMGPRADMAVIRLSRIN